MMRRCAKYFSNFLRLGKSARAPFSSCSITFHHAELQPRSRSDLFTCGLGWLVLTFNRNIGKCHCVCGSPLAPTGSFQSNAAKNVRRMMSLICFRLFTPSVRCVAAVYKKHTKMFETCGELQSLHAHTYHRFTAQKKPCRQTSWLLSRSKGLTSTSLGVLTSERIERARTSVSEEAKHTSDDQARTKVSKRRSGETSAKHSERKERKGKLKKRVSKSHPAMIDNLGKSSRQGGTSHQCRDQRSQAS